MDIVVRGEVVGEAPRDPSSKGVLLGLAGKKFENEPREPNDEADERPEKRSEPRRILPLNFLVGVRPPFLSISTVSKASFEAFGFISNNMEPLKLLRRFVLGLGAAGGSRFTGL